MESLVWFQPDYIDWQDGERRLTGPGIIDRNEAGQAIRLRPFGTIPPEPETDQIEEESAPAEASAPPGAEPGAASVEIVPGSRVVGG